MRKGSDLVDYIRPRALPKGYSDVMRPVRNTSGELFFIGPDVQSGKILSELYSSKSRWMAARFRELRWDKRGKVEKRVKSPLHPADLLSIRAL